MRCSIISLRFVLFQFLALLCGHQLTASEGCTRDDRHTLIFARGDDLGLHIAE